MTGREKLLQAALTLFGSQGYDATTTDQIVEKAGVSKGLLFHHFNEKSGLLEDIIRHYFISLIPLQTRMEAEADPMERLAMVARELGHQLREDETMHRFFVTTFLNSKYRALAERVLLEDPERFNALGELERHAFADMGSATPERDALLWRATLHGIAQLYLFTPQSFPLEDALSAVCDHLGKNQNG